MHAGPALKKRQAGDNEVLRANVSIGRCERDQKLVKARDAATLA